MINTNLKLILLIALSGLLNGCGPSTGELQFSEKITGAQTQIMTEKLKVVQKELLENRCAGCHGWVSNMEELLKRTTPGEPLESTLYLRLEDGSMPLFGTAFNEEELEKVAQAIRALKE